MTTFKKIAAFFDGVPPGELLWYLDASLDWVTNLPGRIRTVTDLLDDLKQALG